MCFLGAKPNPKPGYQSHMVSSLHFWREELWILWNLGPVPEFHRCCIRWAKEKGYWQTHVYTHPGSWKWAGDFQSAIIFSLCMFSKNHSVRQESLCTITDEDMQAQRGQMACPKTHSRARIQVFCLYEHCLSPCLESSLPKVCNFARLVHGCSPSI